MNNEIQIEKMQEIENNVKELYNDLKVIDDHVIDETSPIAKQLKQKEYIKEYRIHNKDKIKLRNDKIVHCEYCKKDIKKYCESQHNKTKSHLKNVDRIQMTPREEAEHLKCYKKFFKIVCISYGPDGEEIEREIM